MCANFLIRNSFVERRTRDTSANSAENLCWHPHTLTTWKTRYTRTAANRLIWCSNVPECRAHSVSCDARRQHR